VLIFSRKPGQKIRIGDDIEVTILEVKGRKVRVGIMAPKGVAVHREEVFQKIMEENVRAAASASEMVNDLPGLDDIKTR